MNPVYGTISLMQTFFNLTKQDFIFSNEFKCRLARHFVFWIVFAAYIFLFRLYVRTTGEMVDKNVYLHKFHTLLLFFPVSFFFSYFSSYYLLPKYILKGKYLQLLVIVVLLCTALSIICYWLTPLFDIRVVWDIPMEREPMLRKLDFIVNNVLVYPLTVSGFAIGIKMSKDFYLKQKENEQLAKQKLKKEIDLLKAQIHPRFLFHTLDAVYNDTLNGFEKSPGMLLKLSDLLSYILYENNAELVPLEKELKITEDYIALENLNYGTTKKITFTNKALTDEKLITPLILLPLIESFLEIGYETSNSHCLNAQTDFKDDRFYIDLSMKLVQDKPAADFRKNKRLVQVQKRLELSYPGKHFYNLKQQDGYLQISLTIVLDNSSPAATLVAEKQTLLYENV